MADDIYDLDASELAARIAAKQLSPVEVTRAHLERIDRVNPRVNAVVTVNSRALDEARAAEAALMRGETLGPLHGVPFTAKDCFDVAGIRTTRGSRLFAERVATTTATAVSRLRAAGGVFLGKTNIPEFALWWETDNLVFGRTLNPWNAARIAGGSSGGEAAALAAGLSPLGLGSDVGGSIRQPAHCCGVVGLKPTHGRVPLTGHWPDTLLRAMHVGPMARSVRDLGLALGVLAGPDGYDPYAMPVPLPAIPTASEALPALRIGLSSTGGVTPVDSQVERVVQRAAKQLADLGCHVEPVNLAALEQHDWNALTMILFAAEAGPFFDRVIAGRHAELNPVLRRRLAFPVKSLGDYAAALDAWEGLRHEIADFFTRYDLLLSPTSPLPAPEHGLTELTMQGKTVPARHALRNTLPWDLTGSPALAVAYGWSADRLPIAVQVIGRHFAEATVLRAGLALEAASEVLGRRPTL